MSEIETSPESKATGLASSLIAAAIVAGLFYLTQKLPEDGNGDINGPIVQTVEPDLTLIDRDFTPEELAEIETIALNSDPVAARRVVFSRILLGQLLEKGETPVRVTLSEVGNYLSQPIIPQQSALFLFWDPAFTEELRTFLRGQPILNLTKLSVMLPEPVSTELGLRSTLAGPLLMEWLGVGGNNLDTSTNTSFQSLLTQHYPGYRITLAQPQPEASGDEQVEAMTLALNKALQHITTSQTEPLPDSGRLSEKERYKLIGASVLSIILVPLCIGLIWSRRTDENVKRSAFTVLGTIIGFWLA